MIKTGRYNDIPEKFIPKMPKKAVTFKYITGDGKDPADRKSYPAGHMVTNHERIMLDDKMYEIAHIDKVLPTDGGEQLEFGDIWFKRRNFGEIMCRPGHIKEESLYKYLMLHPWNESNPHRPEHVPPVFKVLNTEVEAKKKLDVSREEIKARYRAIDMEDKEVRLLAEYFGFDTRLKPTVLREKLENKATIDPEGFLDADAYASREGTYLAMVRKGKRHNIISMDGRNSKWKWNESKEVFKAGDPEVSVEQNEFKLAEWLRNNEDGKKVAITLGKALEKFEGEYEV